MHYYLLLLIFLKKENISSWLFLYCCYKLSCPFFKKTRNPLIRSATDPFLSHVPLSNFLASQGSPPALDQRCSLCRCILLPSSSSSSYVFKYLAGQSTPKLSCAWWGPGAKQVKGVWRCCTKDSGAPCAMMTSTSTWQMWPAESWAMIRP